MGIISNRRGGYKHLLLMVAVLTGITIIGTPQRSSAAENVQENVSEAETIINQATLTWQNFMQDLDLASFRTQLKEAQGVVIFPKLTKGAFVFGLEGGNGVLIVRDGKTGSWSAPAFYEMSAASFGLQAGMETSEAVLIVQTVKGIDGLLSNTVKLGADASAVIGGSGTAGSMGKDFVSYARTKGVFAGLSIDGASIRTRDDLNKAYYGSAVRPSDIVLVRSVKPNPQSQALHQSVAKATGGK